MEGGVGVSVAVGAPCSHSGGGKLCRFQEADIPSPPPAPSASPSSSLLPRILWLTSQPLRIFRMRSQRKLALNPTHSAQCFGGQLWWGFLNAHLDLTKAASPGPRALDVSVSSLWKAPFWAQSPQQLVDRAGTLRGSLWGDGGSLSDRTKNSITDPPTSLHLHCRQPLKRPHLLWPDCFPIQMLTLWAPGGPPPCHEARFADGPHPYS